MANAKQELENFKEEERVEGFYENLTEKEKIKRNLKYTELKIAVDIERKKLEEFYKKRDETFKKFQIQKEKEFNKLAAEWQTKEDEL